jgi:hypothetical protein
MVKNQNQIGIYFQTVSLRTILIILNNFCTTSQLDFTLELLLNNFENIIQPALFNLTFEYL